MRVARSVLLLCLVAGLVAIAYAARGHLRELDLSFQRGADRAALADLGDRARDLARTLRERLESGPVTAVYAPGGLLLRPAPPGSVRPWRPPAMTPATVFLASGDHKRALEAAQSSADRAQVYLAYGSQKRDAASLERALREEALRGTQMYYRAALELFRVQDRAPDADWIDDVSALLGGQSERTGRALLKEAGVEPVGDHATRRRLAGWRATEGRFAEGAWICSGSPEGGRLFVRAVHASAESIGEGPLSVPLPEPFRAVTVRGPAAVAGEAPGRAQLVAYWSLAGVLLLAGAVYAYIAIGREARSAASHRDFLANVTHELRTPIANIRLFAESLAEGRVREEDRAEFLDTILKEGARLDTLVEGLLHAARGPKLEKTHVDLNGLVREAEERWRPRLEREGFDFSVEAASLPSLRADRETLLRAIDNLLDNARKYSGESKRIVLRGFTRNGSVHLTVLDSGPGIPVGDRSRVLRPFSRLESADTKETAGTGLGLSLVVACMKAHGGSISIRDAPGHGAAVSLILPVETGGGEHA